MVIATLLTVVVLVTIVGLVLNVKWKIFVVTMIVTDTVTVKPQLVIVNVICAFQEIVARLKTCVVM